MTPFANLNPYSQRFARQLFASRPQWEPLARTDPDGSPPPGSLLLEVPSPVAGRALMIRTYGDQVTVDFGGEGWHEHFGTWSGRTENDVFRVALDFIDDLVSDRIVVVTRVMFGKRLWSRALGANRLRRPRFGKLEVRSWSGRLDG